VTAHAVRVELSEPVPPEVAVGSNVRARVQVSCAAGCDLAGLALIITAPDDSKTTYAVGPPEGAGNITDIIVTAPVEVGQHRWHLAAAPRDADDVHAPASLDLAIAARPHETSLAVWAVPDTAVAGEPFTVKAGVKCADGCQLQRQRIDVVDAAGTIVAAAEAGSTPWEGTSALYWGDLTLAAPRRAGLLTLTARIAVAQELAHAPASSSFSLAVVKPPEHTLSVKVIAKDTVEPIPEADIRLGPYRARTGASGVAELRIAGGAYDLHVWKAGFDAPAKMLNIRADTSLDVEAAAVPEEDPDAYWKM
jgi:hypothetical protein